MVLAYGRNGIVGIVILGPNDKILPMKYNKKDWLVMRNTEETHWENEVIKPYGEILDASSPYLGITEEKKNATTQTESRKGGLGIIDLSDGAGDS